MELIIYEIAPKFTVFLLILVRMAGLFLMSPVFGRQNVPAYLKLGLALFFSYIVFSGRYLTPQSEVWNYLEFGLLILREILVGFTMGFITTLIFSAIWTAGQIIDTQIGFGIVNVMDPQHNIQVPMMGNFKNILALITFFILNGHHTLIAIIFGSYDLIPLGQGVMGQGLWPLIAKLFADCFILALRIALPMVAIIFLSEVAFGILIRVVPQMNIFIIGIPVKIFIGLVAVLVFIPVYISSLNGVFDGMFNNVREALWEMVPR